MFVLLLRFPATTPTTPSSVPSDPLLHNDPTVSRAFAQQTKIRFLRAGTSSEDIQRTLREIIATLDAELGSSPNENWNGGVSPTSRARGQSSPAPFVRNHSNSSTHSLGIGRGDGLNNLSNVSLPNLERRGSEASAGQIPPMPPPSTTTMKPGASTMTTTTIPFQKSRPFHLSLNRERSTTALIGTSPPQSPKTLKLDLSSITPNPSQEPLSADIISSRVPFVIPQPPPKFADPPSPAGTTPAGSRRHSRLLDSESDLASDLNLGEEGSEFYLLNIEVGSSLLLDDEFSRALANLNLATEGGGLTWEELVERLINPGIPGDGTQALPLSSPFPSPKPKKKEGPHPCYPLFRVEFWNSVSGCCGF